MNRTCRSIVGLVTAAGLASTALASPDTTFTYQGKLLSGGAPVNAVVNAQFTLWDAAGGGSQVAGPVGGNVNVVDGVLSFDVDFGAAAFPGAERWIQASINGNTLSPPPAGPPSPVLHADSRHECRQQRQGRDRARRAVRRRPSEQSDHRSRSTSASERPAGPSTYGGMYLSTASQQGWPFYGYAAGGDADAWTYFDGSTNEWKLWAGADRIVVDKDTGFVGLNRDNRISVQEFFGFNASVPDNIYGGMYVSTDTESGWPFYGYAAGNSSDCWTYLNGATDIWHMWFNGEKISVRGDNGFVGIGRSSQVTGAESFGVNAPAGDGAFGGMYVNTDSNFGLPFYGYSTNRAVDAYHYYDGTLNEWKLWVGGTRMTVENNGEVGIGTTNPRIPPPRQRLGGQARWRLLDQLLGHQPQEKHQGS